MVELKDEVLEGATGGAASKAQKEEEVRKQAFIAKCNTCWKMGATKCDERLKAEKSGWAAACTQYKHF